MDQLIREERLRKGKLRPAGAKTLAEVPMHGDANGLAPFSFSLQDDIPQKP
jgi:hypothetical protein